MTDPSLNPSLKDRLNDISTDVQLLASQTLALARLEVSAAASKFAWSAVGVLASVLVAVAGAAVLVSAAGADSDRSRRSGVGCVDTRRGRAHRRRERCAPVTSSVRYAELRLA